MNLLSLNLLLALLWAAVTGTVTLANLAVGFLIGTGVLAVVGRAVGDIGYLSRLFRGLGLALFFLWELLVSSFRVAWDVITPRHNMSPAVVAVPLDVSSDAEITLLANLISLTPGTLSLDVSEDKKTLFVHAMYVDDADAFRRSIKHDFERRVRGVMT